MKWTLDDGLALVRALQGETRRFGYHLALGGSVLNKGVSEKDLDLYFLPLDNGVGSTPRDMIRWLSNMWGDPQEIPSYGQADDDPVNHSVEGSPLQNSLRGIMQQQLAARMTDVGAQVLSRNYLAQPRSAPPFDSRTDRLVPPPGWLDNDVPFTGDLPKTKSPYLFKLKFTRAGNERIDVFILGV